MSVESVPTVDASDEAVSNQELLAMVREQQARIEHLESELQEERQEREKLEETLGFVKEMVFDLDDVVIGSEFIAEYYTDENPPILRQLEDLSDGETLSDLREDLINEQKTRSR